MTSFARTLRLPTTIQEHQVFDVSVAIIADPLDNLNRLLHGPKLTATSASPSTLTFLSVMSKVQQQK